MAVNKVIYGGNTLVDLTSDTVTAADLADGVKATGADGNPVIGLMQKVTIDAELSTTSTNPVQNKAIKEALDGKLGKNETAVNASKVNNLTVETAVPKNAKFTDTVYTHPSTHPASMITGLASVATSGSYSDLSNKPTIPVVPTNVSAFINDAGYLTQHQSLDGYAKTSVANTWTAQQNFQRLKFNFESFATSLISGTFDSPATSVATYNVTGALTLDMSTLAGMISNGDTSIFTAYIASNGSYALSITNAGTLKYAGSAADLAITASGLLLNIFLTKNARGVVTSIVQASKLS